MGEIRGLMAGRALAILRKILERIMVDNGDGEEDTEREGGRGYLCGVWLADIKPYCISATDDHPLDCDAQ